MEALRWILLVAGVAFILLIYVLGRNRRRRNHSPVDEFEDDLPAFAARSLDDVDEGVGEVRIITSTEPATDENNFGSVNPETDSNPYNDNAADESIAQQGDAGKSRTPADIIVLFILPKADQLLLGAQINSSAQAMGLTFGEMNIFHYKSQSGQSQGRNIFSLANMMEPGSFDADTIHDIKTRGLTVFMQLRQGDPLDDLTEMLQRSYQLAGLLGARLCNHKREPLTEQDAENYRKQVRDFINGETAEPATET